MKKRRKKKEIPLKQKRPKMTAAERTRYAFKLPQELSIIGLEGKILFKGLPCGALSLGHRTLDAIADRIGRVRREQREAPKPLGPSYFRDLTRELLRTLGTSVSMEPDLARIGRAELSRLPGATTFARCGSCTHAMGVRRAGLVVSGQCKLLQDIGLKEVSAVTHAMACILAEHPDALEILQEQERADHDKNRKDTEHFLDLYGLFGGLSGVPYRWMEIPLHPALRTECTFRPGDRVWYYFPPEEALSVRPSSFIAPDTWVQGEVLSVGERGGQITVLFDRAVWTSESERDPINARLVEPDLNYPGLLTNEAYETFRSDSTGTLARLSYQAQPWRWVSTREQLIAALLRK